MAHSPLGISMFEVSIIKTNNVMAHCEANYAVINDIFTCCISLGFGKKKKKAYTENI